MDKRDKDLRELRLYIEGVEKEVTMLLQSLQWDRKHLLEGSALAPCRYDATHKVPPDKKESHEEECLLRREGYSKDDIMLPDPFDPEAATVVKLNKEDIQKIIERAAQAGPSFRRGPGCPLMAPLTAERLRACYSADELRAIHDHVVSTAPDFEHVEDIEFASAEVKAERRRKSRLEVLAELRDMRRRRAKYRGAGAGAGSSRNYSNVLRDLIKTQMELYTGTSGDAAPVTHPSTSRQTSTNRDNTIHIKQEPKSDDESAHAQEHNNGDTYSQRNHDRDRSYREQIDPRRRDHSNSSLRNRKDGSQFTHERETNKHYDRRRRGAGHVKQEPASDDDDQRRERRKERERHRHSDRYDDTQRHSETKEKHAHHRYSHGRHSDSRREASKHTRYEYSRDNIRSNSRTRREDPDTSSRDAHSSKRMQSEDRDSRHESHHSHHKRSKYRERSVSTTRDTDGSNEDNMYKRYYAMKRALADPKR